MKIQFKKSVTSPEVKIRDGNYARTFKASSQPFTVTEEVWGILERYDLFEPFVEASAAPAKEKAQTRRRKSSSAPKIEEVETHSEEPPVAEHVEAVSTAPDADSTTTPAQNNADDV